MTVRDVYDFINRIAPFSTQDSFDNAGLLVGDMNISVTKIAVCLDITRQAALEAAEKGAELIVSHHPVIFHKLSALEICNPVSILAKHGISAVCAHTNLDMARGGISDVMLELLDFKGETQVLLPVHKNGSGYGRIVKLDFAADAKTLAGICKKAFGCTVVRYYDSERVIKTVGVCSGAGGNEEEVANACAKGCDALITGDVKHSGFIEAANRGLTLIDAGHFHTESIICPVLEVKLQREFDVDVFVADSCRDLVEYAV